MKGNRMTEKGHLPVTLPSQIIFTRHPQCEFNENPEDSLLRGISKYASPITKMGETQSIITAEWLKRTFGTLSAVYCSESVRTHAIPLAMGIDFTIDARLNERDMGILHRQMQCEIETQYPGELDTYKVADYYSYVPPGGESCVDTEKNLQDFLHQVLANEGVEVAYLSGHGISGLCLRRLLTGATVEMWHRWHRGGERLKNASVTVYKRKGDFYECTLYNHVPWETKKDSILEAQVEEYV